MINVVLKPPASIKIYLHIFLWIGSRGIQLIEGPLEPKNLNLPGLFSPSFGDECLVNNSKEKMTGVFFQPVLLFGSFFLFPFQKNLEVNGGRGIQV